MPRRPRCSAGPASRSLARTLTPLGCGKRVFGFPATAPGANFEGRAPLCCGASLASRLLFFAASPFVQSELFPRLFHAARGARFAAFRRVLRCAGLALRSIPPALRPLVEGKRLPFPGDPALGAYPAGRIGCCCIGVADGRFVDGQAMATFFLPCRSRLRCQTAETIDAVRKIFKSSLGICQQLDSYLSS